MHRVTHWNKSSLQKHLCIGSLLELTVGQNKARPIPNNRRAGHSMLSVTWHMELNHGDKMHLKIGVQNNSCSGKSVHLDKDKDYIFSVKLIH